MSQDRNHTLTSSHWGIGVVETNDGRISAVRDHDSDPHPADLNANMASSLTGRARVLRPAVRKGWLDGHGKQPKGTRGTDPFVEVSWDTAFDLVATELTRQRTTHGNEAIFAGSYGWASAGRFHHAQSQLKRFLNVNGGFVRSEGNYSYNAALVAMPYIVGENLRTHIKQATRWSVIAEHTKLVVLFGGMPMRNMQICDGGASRHRMQDNLAACRANGVRFINISPLRSDVDASLDAEWLAPRPGTDTAVMLGLCHELLRHGLHDADFLTSYTTGFQRIAAYIQGDHDDIPKTVEWAGRISGLDPARLSQLAREMASQRTMIGCAAGLQRADWGEQPLWATVTLAAMLGQIGLPGGGYTVGYGVNGHVGAVSRPFRWGAFPQGRNPIKTMLPVAMISDMLLTPGAPYRYDGKADMLPQAKMVWWAGGNPFHHHQDLRRLSKAFQRPETIIVNEINWTATARHADIVLPVASPLERMDFGAGQTDNILVPMPPAAAPPGEARTEYAIYTELARRLGTEQAFTEGRSEEDWLRHMWDETRIAAQDQDLDLPPWDDFIAGGPVELPDPAPDRVFLSDFRADPKANPRPTKSGRLELYSSTVAGFQLADCPGHASWFPPRDLAVGAYPLAMVSGQPATRLHSQHDNGALSVSQKIQGREPVLINPKDAAARNVADGDVVELFNDRGRCLAGARVTEDVAPGTVFLWTGAWYDPDPDPALRRCNHGNPNVLTHDLRTSELSQSPASHSCNVDLRRFEDALPPITVHDPPDFVQAAPDDIGA